MDKIKEQYGEDFVPPDFIKRKYSSAWSEDKNLLNFKVNKNELKTCLPVGEIPLTSVRWN